MYEEVFRVCERWGGYVHLNYFLGLWHYRLCEQGPLSRAIGKTNLWKLAGRVHFAIHTQMRESGSRARRAIDLVRIVSGARTDLPGLQDWSESRPSASWGVSLRGVSGMGRTRRG